MGRAPCVALTVILGCGRVGFDAGFVADYVFVDDEQAEFDQGDYTTGIALLVHDGTQVRFADAPPFDTSNSGVFVSRVFDTGDAAAIWDTVAWVPIAPQGRPLADGRADDMGYAEAGVSMADNILLLHLDGIGDTADGATVPDASGTGHDGQIVLAGQGARHIAGAFDQALDIDRDAWVTLDYRYFDFGTGDFTYSIWVRMHDCAESNDNRIAMGGGGAVDDPHIWIGAGCPESCVGSDGATMIWLDSTRAGMGMSVCSGVVLQDGAWHHMAGVKQGHTPAQLRLYVDGREVGVDTFDFGSATFTYDGGEIRLGGFNLGGNQYNTRVEVDEAAIWKRALDAEQIRAVYRRGVARLEIQVRACSDDTCSGQPFAGPDGTDATTFTEADLTGAAGSQQRNLASLGLVGRFAQYRARFTTGSPQFSPGLVRVSLAARQP